MGVPFPVLDHNMPVAVSGVRAVVLAYGLDRQFEPLLGSLAAEGFPLDHVLLVHNPSAPGEGLPAAPPECEVLSAGYNRGYAAAMNLGIERQLAAGAELLLILTHDARLRPGALGSLIEAARQNPDYGALGPALVFTGTDTPFSFGGLTDRNGTMRHINRAPDAVDGMVPCDWIDGGTMLIRTEVLSRVGGFDERFWSYCEDAELCLRIVRSGWRVGVVLDALADQSPGGSKRPGPWAYLLTRNGASYVRAAYGSRVAVRLLIRTGLHAMRDVLRALARALRLRQGAASEPWALAVGASRGAVDFLRGHWGPPPPLPGGSDLRNLTPSEPAGE
jgi:GT2 family glycosyltransferase